MDENDLLKQKHYSFRHLVFYLTKRLKFPKSIYLSEVNKNLFCFLEAVQQLFAVGKQLSSE